MELYGHDTAKNGSQAQSAPAESTRRSLWGRDEYPERPGVPDCAYYMRTGVCGYGAKCRYNHPRHLDSGREAIQLGEGAYPEKIGEPSCQFYLRTGTCKFGVSCKFHHPRNADGSFSTLKVNVYGYPLRLGEKECSYYLKTGQCKFGIACKFHHPQPTGMSLSAAARLFYPTMQTVSVPSTKQFGGLSPSFKVARPPALPGSYVPGAYAPVFLHPGLAPAPNWRAYTQSVRTALPPGSQLSPGAASLRGISLLETSAPALSGTYPPLPCGPASSIQKEKYFPEKPGQPECQYYMKTGDCKFGSSCKYHHPPEVLASKLNFALSPLGLPLRPGEPPCNYYMQKGQCRFGLVCKFDHPMGTVNYSGSASVTDVSIASYRFNLSGIGHTV